MFKRGLYRHYKKGHLYRVVDVAIHTETQEQMVVYTSAEYEGVWWVRPLDMFVGKVTNKDGVEVPRFQYEGEDNG